MPPMVRRQMYGKPGWLRAAIRRSYFARDAALAIFDSGGVPSLADGGRTSRKLVPLDRAAPLYPVVAALYDRELDRTSSLPIIVLDERAPGGVAIIRLPIEGKRA